MARWLVLIIIGAIVVTGASGCVLVVADEDVAHDIKVETNRSRLARNIAKDLDGNELLRYSNIRVTEDDGLVTLYGEVDGVSLIQTAIDIAARYDGVETIVSRLTVETQL